MQIQVLAQFVKIKKKKKDKERSFAATTDYVTSCFFNSIYLSFTICLLSKRDLGQL